MKAGKYNIKELFVNRYIQQIIIPEIQRDYVWREKQVVGLLESIKGDYTRFKEALIPTIETKDFELIKAFEEFYRKRNFTSNIGFIYAYNDEQYSGKYFLIDGQQRITTIYLFLLVLATKKSDLKKKFEATYLIGDQLKLDYKVREASHNFTYEFVNAVLNGEKDIINQNWYFNHQYDSDTTVQSWLKNFEIISNYIDNNFNSELIQFYDFLENQIDFWYFDTNISQQGEELYIYMNARGEQMQSNENIKADLLSQLNTIDEKNQYGKLWEDWQDFFWKHRGKNENADKGFNEFIKWCKILVSIENKINSKDEFNTDEIEYYADFIRSKNTLELESTQLSIESIENYFEIVKFYFEDYFNVLKEKKASFNLIENKWLNNSISQIESFRLLPFIYFIKKHSIHKKKDYNLKELTKLNRLFYNLRLDETVAKTAATQTVYGIRLIDEIDEKFVFDKLVNFERRYQSIFNEEEVLKLQILNELEFNDKEQLRKIYYSLEDNRIFKGKISHIIYLTKQINNQIFNLSVFSKLSKKYKELLEDTQLLKSELIATDSYTQIGNRIKLNESWFKNSHVMNLLAFFYNYDDSINSFYINYRKEFLSKYDSVEDIINETNPKKQLYIYYLISIYNNICWDLKKGKNFGIYNDNSNLNSLFKNKKYFQHYETQWHNNDWRSIDVQKKEISEKLLKELLKN